MYNFKIANSKKLSTGILPLSGAVAPREKAKSTGPLMFIY